jgi:hypothetical protein
LRHVVKLRRGEKDVKRETARRWRHGKEHVAKGEALLNREGVFVLPPEPERTAEYFGFKPEPTAR